MKTYIETNKERLQKYIEDKGWKEDYAKQIFGTYDVAEHIWKNEKEQKFVYFESDISIKVWRLGSEISFSYL